MIVSLKQTNAALNWGRRRMLKPLSPLKHPRLSGTPILTVNYCSSKPTLPLGYFVERFWEISYSPPHGKERIIPSSTIELVPERGKQLRPCRGVKPSYALPSCVKRFLHL